MIAGGMTSQLTYDGIDVCASRVAWEVDQQVAKLEGEGKTVEISVVGYRSHTADSVWVFPWRSRGPLSGRSAPLSFALIL
jgi:hypothetical protein